MANRKRKKISKEEALALKRRESARKGWETRRKREAAERKIAKKRSKAAKKGWKTRRAVSKKVEKKPVRKSVTPKPVKKPKRRKTTVSKPRKSRPKQSAISKRRIQVQYAKKLEQQIIEMGGLPEGWVSAYPEGYTRRDGTKAKDYSSLRFADNYEKLDKRLKKAERRGLRRLDRTVYEIAEEEGVNVREIYTLFFSP